MHLTTITLLQSLITITTVVTGFFAISQIRLLIKRRTAKDISFIYQFAVWLNALFTLTVLLIIGQMIGFENVFGQIFCSVECLVLVGIILYLIVKYR